MLFMYQRQSYYIMVFNVHVRLRIPQGLELGSYDRWPILLCKQKH
eukprot:COSAG04_NODE_62_length_30099_cov_4.276633_30_plen_45_part_00